MMHNIAAFPIQSRDFDSLADLQRFVDEFIVPPAEHIIVKLGQEHIPTLWCVTKRNLLAVGQVDMRDIEDKNRLRHLIHQTAASGLIKAIGLIVEGWTLRTPEHVSQEELDKWLQSGHSLSEHPNRAECLVITAAASIGIVSQSQRIARIGKDTILGEPETLPQGQSQDRFFTGIAWPEE